ncbi:site-specific integrase [uncultured Alistipes sp.]|uniref:tyrosine-type recombinase/integrase n=1 Tax=uncultured Alistipes sp. TaxID=538949 RepID=UPI00259B1DEE|nr:site-specific integrase [uncultured Alistipes sp.]
MASIKFFTRTTSKDSMSVIHVTISLGRGKQFYLNSGLKVFNDAWSNTTQGIKPRYRYSEIYTQAMGSQLETKLLALRTFLMSKIIDDVQGTLTKEHIQNLIYEFHHPQRTYKKRRNDPDEHCPKRETLLQFIERYVQEIESGKRLNNKKLRYAYYTIKNYKGFLVQFKLYCQVKKQKFDFDDIDLKFYDTMVAYFTNKGYSPNTIGRHIKELKIIMRTAYDEGLTDNKIVENRKFKVLTADVENIALSEKELDKLANVFLGKHETELRQTRDVFLIGCYLAQRYSDYSRINPAMIKTLDSGEKYIDLVQKKTGTRVQIPLNPRCQNILEQYNYQFPKLANVTINKNIKEIARRAGITENVTIHFIQCGEKRETTLPKYELITTHTARRTGATNMVLAGVPIEECMAVTGHKSRAQFERYVKISLQQMLTKLVNNPYFKTGGSYNPMLSPETLLNQFKLFMSSMFANQQQ